MRRFAWFSMVLAVALSAGCVGSPPAGEEINVPRGNVVLNTPGENPQANTEDANGRIAGVLQGFWHGLISPVTLALSFLKQGGQIYEVHNDGRPYNLGFVLGVAAVFVLLGVFASSRRR